MDTKTLYIYTDESGIGGKIGAAIFDASTQSTNLRYLDTEQDSLVFAAELEAIQMAISHIRFHLRQYKECRIFSDSQAALKALSKPQRQTGQIIIKAILDGIEQIHALYPDFSIQLEWIPGHEDIEGNETADRAAKAATQLDISKAIPRAGLQSSRSNAIQQMIKSTWQTQWNTGKGTACQLQNITKAGNNSTGPQIYQSMGNNRKHIAWTTRLRTGHCSLNGYLH
jgi:ribonuclease HI